MFIVLVDNKYYVKNYKQFLFGGGVVDFTTKKSEAAKLPEIVAREIASSLREAGKNTIIKRIRKTGGF